MTATSAAVKLVETAESLNSTKAVSPAIKFRSSAETETVGAAALRARPETAAGLKVSVYPASSTKLTTTSIERQTSSARTV